MRQSPSAQCYWILYHLCCSWETDPPNSYLFQPCQPIRIWIIADHPLSSYGWNKYFKAPTSCRINILPGTMTHHLNRPWRQFSRGSPSLGSLSPESSADPFADPKWHRTTPGSFGGSLGNGPQMTHPWCQWRHKPRFKSRSISKKKTGKVESKPANLWIIHTENPVD